MFLFYCLYTEPDSVPSIIQATFPAYHASNQHSRQASLISDNPAIGNWYFTGLRVAGIKCNSYYYY